MQHNLRGIERNLHATNSKKLLMRLRRGFCYTNVPQQFFIVAMPLRLSYTLHPTALFGAFSAIDQPHTWPSEYCKHTVLVMSNVTFNCTSMLWFQRFNTTDQIQELTSRKIIIVRRKELTSSFSSLILLQIGIWSTGMECQLSS